MSSLSWCTYSSAGDGQLDLTAGGAHEGSELVGNTLKLVESVVLEALAENNRLNQLEGVADKFATLMSAARGEVELTVTSAAVRT